MTRFLLTLVLLTSLAASAAWATLTIPSDGTDGAFAPTSSITIDLSKATTAAWNTPSSNPNGVNGGNGVYDPAQWAVVFKYSSVNIANGVTVTFLNNASHAPVVWLVQGNVTIDGSVVLDGANGGTTGLPISPGPGGFAGGGGSYNIPFIGVHPNDLGFGNTTSGGANYSLIPLVGGSGGNAENSSYNIPEDGGGGGGAILIATSGPMEISGKLTANGGQGGSAYPTRSAYGGSGGAIRLVNNSLKGNGTIAVNAGYPGGDTGRIRLESINASLFTGTALNAQFVPLATSATPAIWPAAGSPRISIIAVNSSPVPADPFDNLNFITPDVWTASTGSTTPVTVTVQAMNMPIDWTVQVQVNSIRDGHAYKANAVMQSGGTALSSLWTATIPAISGPDNVAEVYAKANAPTD